MPLFLIFSSIFFLVSGAIHYELHCRNIQQASQRLIELADTGGKHIISAVVIRAPVQKREKLQVIVRPILLHLPGEEGQPLSGRLSLTVSNGAEGRWQAGDILRFSATLKRVRNFNTPGSFDYENWWALRGVVVKAYVSSPVLLAKTGHVRSASGISALRSVVENARIFLMQRVKEGFSAKEHAAVASALLFGDRSGMPTELSEAFSATGTGHLLAVSGLHMAIIAFLLLKATRWLMLRSERLALHLPVTKLSSLAAMAGVVLYAAMAGFSPSASRAMIMISLFMLAFVCEEPLSPLNTLAAAAWLILLISPLYLFDLSFQLSFTAVFFLILFAPFVHKLNTLVREGVGRCAAYFVSIAVVSAIAVAATAPLIAWYFQRISTVAIAMNLALIPIVCFVLMPLLMTGVATIWLVPAFASNVWQMSEPVIVAMLKLVSSVFTLPGAWFFVARPTLPDILLFYALLAALAWITREENNRIGRYAAATALFLAAMLPFNVYLRYWAQENRTSIMLHVLDVGQGLSQVIELPFGKLMVVDSGGMRSEFFDTGSRIVGPYIRSLGYLHVDYLVLSHAERDHGGGMASMIRDFRPDEVWTNDDTDMKNPCWSEIAAAISDIDSRHVIFHEDREIKFQGCNVHVFTAHDCRGTNTRNSRSLVLKISSYDGNSLLLTGDIDAARELCFVRKDPGRCGAVVVPHHGSRTSSSPEFIEYLKPEFVIFPAGWRNFLNLPAHDVEERWRQAGAKIFVTGRDGTVTVKVARHDFTISAWSWKSILNKERL